MRVYSPYRCDHCSNLKGETNHWWLRAPELGKFTLQRWDHALADMPGYEHICSESCAAKALSKWMTLPSSHATAQSVAAPFGASTGGRHNRGPLTQTTESGHQTGNVGLIARAGVSNQIANTAGGTQQHADGVPGEYQLPRG
jgi:hypothetical protein